MLPNGKRGRSRYMGSNMADFEIRGLIKGGGDPPPGPEGRPGPGLGAQEPRLYLFSRPFACPGKIGIV